MLVAANSALLCYLSCRMVLRCVLWSAAVRRLVLQSFLELDWANAFEIHACVSEEFMLGPLLTALDDPTHHRDFGKFPTFPI